MRDTRSFLCILVHVFQHNIWGSLLVLVTACFPDKSLRRIFLKHKSCFHSTMRRKCGILEPWCLTTKFVHLTHFSEALPRWWSSSFSRLHNTNLSWSLELPSSVRGSPQTWSCLALRTGCSSYSDSASRNCHILRNHPWTLVTSSPLWSTSFSYHAPLKSKMQLLFFLGPYFPGLNEILTSQPTVTLSKSPIFGCILNIVTLPWWLCQSSSEHLSRKVNQVTGVTWLHGHDSCTHIWSAPNFHRKYDIRTCLYSVSRVPTT